MAILQRNAMPEDAAEARRSPKPVPRNGYPFRSPDRLERGGPPPHLLTRMICCLPLPHPLYINPVRTSDSYHPAGASSRRVSVLILAFLAIAAAATVSQAKPKKPAAPPPPIPKDIDPLTGFAEPPHWPIGFIPPCLEKSAKPSREGKYRGLVLAWIPPKAKRLRSVFIIPNNTDSKHIGEHKPIKKVAEKHEMAIIYLRGGGEVHVQPVLDYLAKHTKIKEFSHLPWIVQGKSSRGMFPIRMAWLFPKRTIAGVTYHGETPTWPPKEKTKLAGESILWLNANGESEWGGTWFVHVRPSLLNYRARKNWMPHLLVVKGVGHGNYPDGAGSKGWGKKFPDRVTCIDVWDYIAVYIDKALTLRVPEDKYPTKAPLPLMQIDDSKGYLIDRFAVEDLYRVPHYKLAQDEKTAEYLVGGKAEKPVSGIVAVAPDKKYKPPEGVPVVALEKDKSPRKWLYTKQVRFPMKRDPKKDLGGWEKLRPVPGDKIMIDHKETSWIPLPDKQVAGKRGGISLRGMKQWGGAITLAGYTIIDVPKKTRMKLVAPYSVAGRLQIALNGTPVEHKQVVEFEKGRYPMLAVLRLDGPNWGAIEPLFAEVTEAEIAMAKEMQVELDALAAEQARILREGIKNKIPPIKPVADVPKAERKNYFWVADKEQAQAWFKVHTAKIHKQKFPGP